MRPESAMFLRQLQTLASGVKSLDLASEDLVKEIFRKILENGDTYNVHDLENWFVFGPENVDKLVSERIMNIAHYQKTKYESKNKLRFVPEGDQCGCGRDH